MPFADYYNSVCSSGVTSFETTVKMPSYLVAFIVSEFVYSNGELNDLPQRVFSRKGTEHEQEWALRTGMLVEKRLSGYFDVPFALPKLDQAAIPDFAAGAMENWGLATYREEYLLYNTENSTVNTQTNIATIEAHEDAHMWFGDLVAIEWWSYLWLKEGFATLFEHLAVDLVSSRRDNQIVMVTKVELTFTGLSRVGYFPNLPCCLLSECIEHRCQSQCPAHDIFCGEAI